MRRLMILGSLFVLALPTYWLQAQAPHIELTETFIDSSEQYQFNYPADWEPSFEADAPIFTIPVESESIPYEDVMVESDALNLMVFLNEGSTDLTPTDIALQEVETMAMADEVSDPIAYRLTGRPAAQINSVNMIFSFSHIVLQIAPDTYLVAMLTGSIDQIVAATPIVLEVLNTARYQGDTTPLKPLVLESILPQNYSSDGLSIHFDYPADWVVEDTENYVLVTAPSGLSVGLSSYTFFEDEFPADTENLAAFEVETKIPLILEQLPDGTATEVTAFELEGRPAASATVQDNQGGNLGLLSVQLDEVTVGRITIIGSPYQIAQAHQVILGIAASLDSN